MIAPALHHRTMVGLEEGSGRTVSEVLYCILADHDV
jgi:hypothetical protein